MQRDPPWKSHRLFNKTKLSAVYQTLALLKGCTCLEPVPYQSLDSNKFYYTYCARQMQISKLRDSFQHHTKQSTLPVLLNKREIRLMRLK